MTEGVAFVRNFGWAPQRFQSQARLYARESRRWHAIWSAVAAEADGKDPKRRDLAVHLLSSLSGPQFNATSSVGLACRPVC